MRLQACVAVFVFAFNDSMLVDAAIVPGSKNLGAIWFVGDSITQGVADQDPSGFTMRSAFYNYLTSQGYTFSYTGNWTANSNGLPITGAGPADNLYQYHSGVSGAVIGTNFAGRVGIMQNIPAWWTSSSSRLSFARPNVILLMIGANDANLGIDISNAPSRLSQLIATIYAQPGIGRPTILVATITPDRANARAPTNVFLLNAGIPDVVQQYQNLGNDVYMVDNYTLLNANYTASMNTDNLHPNAVGNNFMASNWLSTISGYVGATVPALPCGFNAIPTNSLVVLSWSAVPGATSGYSVKRSLASGGPYTNIITGLNTNGFSDANVVNRTTYFYSVTAVNAKGESDTSMEIAATPAALSPPTLTATQSKDQATLNWSAVAGATGYIVKRSLSNGGPYSVIATNLTTSFVNGGLIIGSTHYFVVSAFNAQGESPDSAQVTVSVVLPTLFYIGDDSMEGTNVTSGNGQDSISSPLTYVFVQSGTTYTNTSSSVQAIQLSRVNFQAGTAGGSLKPFVANYTGGQNATDVANKLKFTAILVGDPISVTPNSGLQSTPFITGGTNPIINLNPGGILAAGYLASGGGVIQLQNLANGLIDYIYNGNSLPSTFPSPLSMNSSFALDRTLKFNIGFGVGVPTTNWIASSVNPSVYGSSVIFTDTIYPPPTNGEPVVFMDGSKILGGGVTSGGQAWFSTNGLTGGAHSITAVYGGDFHFLSSSSAPYTQNVVGSAPNLTISAINSGQLKISWPAANLGWFLQVETNSSDCGLSTNWVTIPTSSLVTNVDVTNNPAGGSMFYRIVAP